MMNTAILLLQISAKGKEVGNLDPLGIGMAFIGMGVVFLSLLMLYLMFLNITKILFAKERRKHPQGQTKKVEPMTEEVNAAIALALHLHLAEKHDQENLVLTINRAAKMYSPWSSKIYGLRQYPVKSKG